MNPQFKIETVLENGYGHYKITNPLTGETIHCDFNELNDTLQEFKENTN